MAGAGAAALDDELGERLWRESARHAGLSRPVLASGRWGGDALAYNQHRSALCGGPPSRWMLTTAFVDDRIPTDSSARSNPANVNPLAESAPAARNPRRVRPSQCRIGLSKIVSKQASGQELRTAAEAFFRRVFSNGTASHQHKQICVPTQC